ncbi:MAG: hypothetical protein ACTSU4_05160 [Promethearchaeota archaeon]
MTCDQCLGLLLISIACFIIMIYLTRDYFERKKLYSIWMALFYFIAGLIWLLKFFLLDWLFNVYTSFEAFYLIIQLIPFLFLMIVLLNFLIVKWIYWLFIIAGTAILSIVHSFIPLNLIMYYVLLSFIAADMVLLVLNWRKYKNVRDLGVILGLGVIFSSYFFLMFFNSEMMHGILLTIAALIWGINYTKVTEKVE